MRNNQLIYLKFITISLHSLAIFLIPTASGTGIRSWGLKAGSPAGAAGATLATAKTNVTKSEEPMTNGEGPVADEQERDRSERQMLSDPQPG